MEESVLADTWKQAKRPVWWHVGSPATESRRESFFRTHLFQRCRYLLLLPGESKRGSFSRGCGCQQGCLIWSTETCDSIQITSNPKKVFSIDKMFRPEGSRAYTSAAVEWGSTGRTRAVTHSFGIQDGICWRNMTCTPPDEIRECKMLLSR